MNGLDKPLEVDTKMATAKPKRRRTRRRPAPLRALVSGATFWRFDSSPIPRRADVFETGDIGG